MMKIDYCSDCEHYKDTICVLHKIKVLVLDNACFDFLTKLNK